MLPISVGRLVPCLQNCHRRYRIGGKRIAQTNVPADQRIRDVAGLRLDPPGRGACRSGAGHEPSAQRVSGVPGRIEADRPDPLLHDRRDGVAPELTGQHLPAPGDRPEHRPLRDAGPLQPLFQRLDRADRVSAPGNGDLASLALLVGLALRNLSMTQVLALTSEKQLPSK